MKRDFSHVHPELRPAAEKIPGFSFNAKNLRFLRLLERLAWARKTQEGVHIENIFIPDRLSEKTIRLRTYRPKRLSSPVPGLIWLHGGGYVIGRPEIDDTCCVQYARELGIVVISVDYRCAPEHLFPAPLEDAYSALAWVHEHPDRLGVDPERMAIGGNSAGGGLAAALTQLAFDRKKIKPVFQLLVYPMLDDRTTTRTDFAQDRYFVWNQESNRFGWTAYLGQACGAQQVPPYAAPARREELVGLPPAWIGVGSLDLFHDEDVAYAERLNEYGVTAELVVVPGAFHGFDITSPQTQVVHDFRNSQFAALRRSLIDPPRTPTEIEPPVEK